MILTNDMVFPEEDCNGQNHLYQLILACLMLLKSEGRCWNANIHFEVGLCSKTSSNHLTSDNFTLVQIKEINLRHRRGET